MLKIKWLLNFAFTNVHLLNENSATKDHRIYSVSVTEGKSSHLQPMTGNF